MIILVQLLVAFFGMSLLRRFIGELMLRATAWILAGPTTLSFSGICAMAPISSGVRLVGLGKSSNFIVNDWSLGPKDGGE